MDAALWVSKTGLDAQQTRMNVISNNLANVSTTGFKRDRAVFEDLLYQNIRQAGGQTTANTQAPTGLMLGTGTKVVATEKLHIQGNLINSQNPLDVAIMGDGFFQIQQQDGTIAYTRDGAFKLTGTGQLVTSTGFFLEPNVTIPGNASSLTIGRDGTVSVELVGGQGQQVLGQIQIAKFINPSGLKPLGNNLMAATAASGPVPVAVDDPEVEMDAADGELLDARELGVPLGAAATLVQFSTAFCQPCRATRRILDEVSSMVEGVVHVEIDAEAHLELVRRLDIRRTPTVLILDREGIIRKRASGLPRKADVIAAVGSVTGPANPSQ